MITTSFMERITGQELLFGEEDEPDI